MSAAGGVEIELERCGCSRDPRRVCDLCRTPQHAFLACSLSCLRTHQRAAHGSVPEETARRVRQAQREMNRRAPDASDWYTPHRRRVMDELPRVPGDLCVLGAGNCADIDFEFLAKRFDEIHLVDIDENAIFPAFCSIWTTGRSNFRATPSYSKPRCVRHMGCSRASGDRST